MATSENLDVQGRVHRGEPSVAGGWSWRPPLKWQASSHVRQHGPGYGTEAELTARTEIVAAFVSHNSVSPWRAPAADF